MKQESEKKLITDYLKDKLVEFGWRFVPGADLERVGLEEPLLLGNLRTMLACVNANLRITDKEIDDVIREIKLVPTGEVGCRQMLHYLKYGVGVKFYRDKVVKIVNLFDFENLANNEFIVSREVYFKGNQAARLDIILYVNGIPLANIEGKNPLSLSVSWRDAYRQIKQYERGAGEAYKYIQLGAVADAEAKYFGIAPWRDEVETYEWKEDGLDAIDALAEFFRPQRFLDILRNFLFVREEKGSYNKVVARYMQYRAVNKICDRVIGNLEGKDDKNKGLIWHWQGSGKTLTMIMAAHKLYFNKLLEGPSVFFIIDRRDLEEQLSNELSSLDLNFRHETVASVNDMAQVVRADDYRGKRGVFVTLLHKFESGRQWFPVDFGGGQKTTIADRKNVICFLDEVHRTQYGLLAAQMKHILRSAFYFGFTGTPVDEAERDTYREFGYPVHSEDYLDKYFINESLADGFTVPVVFMPRQEKLHLSTEDLKLLIEKIGKEDAFSVDEKEKIEDGAARKLDKIKIFLEDEQRIGKIAEDIAGHFNEFVAGRFKAMAVCGSRKACVVYKQKLDALLGEDASEIVMTFNTGDQKIIADYYGKWKAKYPGMASDKDIRDEIVRRFKLSIGANPQILIVTDMLLTGFDAPILQTMYFDKPLKKHRLLQAIARVNRLYGEVKKAGVIVDYAGILREAKRAHQMYYEDEKGTTVPFEYQYLADNFVELAARIKKIVGAAPESIDRLALAEAVNKLRSESSEKDFFENYRELRKIFELLGNGKIKLDYLADY
ncbi:MAG: HsdR family type I site-specific deoxyribonuclease, partial [Candidatus Paceibacterota bacterium]